MSGDLFNLKPYTVTQFGSSRTLAHREVLREGTRLACLCISLHEKPDKLAALLNDAYQAGIKRSDQAWIDQLATESSNPPKSAPPSDRP